MVKMRTEESFGQHSIDLLCFDPSDTPAKQLGNLAILLYLPEKMTLIELKDLVASETENFSPEWDTPVPNNIYFEEHEENEEDDGSPPKKPKETTIFNLGNDVVEAVTR